MKINGNHIVIYRAIIPEADQERYCGFRRKLVDPRPERKKVVELTDRFTNERLDAVTDFAIASKSKG